MWSLVYTDFQVFVFCDCNILFEWFIVMQESAHPSDLILSLVQQMRITGAFDMIRNGWCLVIRKSVLAAVGALFLSGWFYAFQFIFILSALILNSFVFTITDISEASIKFMTNNLYICIYTVYGGCLKVCCL